VDKRYLELKKVPKKKYGYHVNSGVLSYGSARRIEVGATLEMEPRRHTTYCYSKLYRAAESEDNCSCGASIGRPQLCCAGMHASPTPKECEYYVPIGWPGVCHKYIDRVSVEGDIVVGEDKFCGRRRKVIDRVRSEEYLTAMLELFGSYFGRSITNKESIQVWKRARELRDMMGLKPGE